MREAKAAGAQGRRSAAQASSQLRPGSPASATAPAGRGGAGGSAVSGHLRSEKQYRRSRMKAFSCCVLREVVRHAPRQNSNADAHSPVSGLHRNAAAREQ